ncbi:MAG: helix-turn-helix domain-containing protein, partial [Alphaproteobacteria bacterium]|nr:helix-turn-helix domain-containing protein [Alphaproteobacteria bacterium]
MPNSVWLGNKVRRLRRERGLAQVELARQLGISASYLNMIERNQRPLTARLLEQTADFFEVGTAALAQDEDSRLLVGLMEIFGDAAFAESGVTRDDLQEIVNVAPAAGRALVDLYRVFRATRDDVEALRERMTDDNFLSTSAYELRSVLTPIRSFAEILHDHENIDRSDQQRFAGILVRESERLAEIIDRMLSLSSGTSQASDNGARLPEEQITDFLQIRLNYFAA